MHVSIAAVLGFPLMNNMFEEVDPVHEMYICAMAISVAGSRDHRLVALDITQFPVIFARVQPEVPEPSDDKFYNDICEPYKDLGPDDRLCGV